jgi:hypothetical protein
MTVAEGVVGEALAEDDDAIELGGRCIGGQRQPQRLDQDQNGGAIAGSRPLWHVPSLNDPGTCRCNASGHAT